MVSTLDGGAPRIGCQQFQGVANELADATMPESFRAVGRWYEHFDKTSDEDEQTLLEAARNSQPSP